MPVLSLSLSIVALLLLQPAPLTLCSLTAAVLCTKPVFNISLHLVVCVFCSISSGCWVAVAIAVLRLLVTA
jgi:hypothetical protein